MKLLSEVNEDRTHYFSFSVGVFVVMEIDLSDEFEECLVLLPICILKEHKQDM